MFYQSYIFLPTLHMQGSHGVKYSKHGHADICKNSHPHGCQSKQRQYQHGYFNANGKPYILLGNRQCTTSYADGKCYLRWLIVHQYDISSLDGSIATQTSHCDTYIGTGQDRSIVDTIAHLVTPNAFRRAMASALSSLIRSLMTICPA